MPFKKFNPDSNCCCDSEPPDPNCDPPDCINGPEASFSYEQISQEPYCCFQFTGTGLPGSCCDEITTYLWDFGDGSGSSEQNPEHCYVGAGPWDVTLTVTDCEGCEDSVIGEVTCEPMYDCDCCEDQILEHVTVIMSGWSNKGTNCPTASGGNCATLNGTFVIPLNNQSTCSYLLDTDDPDCELFGTQTMRITASICTTVAPTNCFLVAVSPGNTGGAQYTFLLCPSNPPFPCRGSHTLTFDAGPIEPAQNKPCNNPTTITLII